MLSVAWKYILKIYTKWKFIIDSDSMKQQKIQHNNFKVVGNIKIT